MKTLLLTAALLLICAASAFAQRTSPASDQSGASIYRVDNFDLASGVRVVTPPAPVAKKLRKGRLLTSNNLNYSHSNQPLTQTTNMNWAGTLSGFTTGDAAVDSYILDSGRRNAVDPLLLYAIMHQESTFKARAMSNKGARGLMQLMPGTAQRFGVTSIWDPRQNIEGGTRYMRFLLDLFDGDVNLALAGYNAGEGAVMKYGYRVPPYSETQEYVRRISRRYDLIRDPMAFRYANSLTRDQLAATQRKDPAPLTMYERSVFAVKLPDGRLQLITQ
ncbi:MAG TPA: lytic transglycosylase domain-containing protein [Pyrinomonadaceae bacterium]